jgi:hypothetical protein
MEQAIYEKYPSCFHFFLLNVKITYRCRPATVCTLCLVYPASIACIDLIKVFFGSLGDIADLFGL